MEAIEAKVRERREEKRNSHAPPDPVRHSVQEREEGARTDAVTIRPSRLVHLRAMRTRSLHRVRLTGLFTSMLARCV